MWCYLHVALFFIFSWSNKHVQHACDVSSWNVPTKLMMLGWVVCFVLCEIIISAFKYETIIQNHVAFQWLMTQRMSILCDLSQPHSHLHEVTTCGIWEAVPLMLPQGFLKRQGCWNRALSHSDSSFRNAEESHNKDATWAVGTMPLLLSSEGNVMPEKSLTRLCSCNKIFR